MKNQKMVLAKMASLIAIFLVVISFSASAQNHKHSSKIKDSSTMHNCCMMKDGKMMVIKNGITMPMKKDMVLKNGTTCKTTGECITKDGKTMMMKEGDCIDMNGKMCTDKMKNMPVAIYSCPMHSDITSAKPNKCPKCGMAMKKKS